MNSPPISDFDLGLHAASLMVGTLALRSYNEDKNSDRTNDLMHAYRALRRYIPENPENGKRYGATIAGEIMRQGFLGIHDEIKEIEENS